MKRGAEHSRPHCAQRPRTQWLPEALEGVSEAGGSAHYEDRPSSPELRAGHGLFGD